MLKKVLIFVMCLTTLFLFTSCKDTIDPDEYTLIREMGTYEKCSVSQFKYKFFYIEPKLVVYDIENIPISEYVYCPIYAYKENAFGKTKYKNLTDAYESGWLTLDDIETISTSYYQVGWKDENYMYELNVEKDGYIDGYIVVKQLNKDLKTIEIPDTVNNLPVVEIYSGVFTKNSNIEEVILPKYLKKIWSSAFLDCINLTEVYFPDSLEEIGSNAFCGSSIEKIELPNKGIRINECAFYGCSNLKEVKVRHNTNSEIQNQNSDETFYEICSNAFSYCDNLTKVELPYGIYNISSFAFEYLDSLENIIIPESVKIIEESTFVYCKSLVEINIPGSVEKIVTCTFEYCDNLEKIIFNDGVKCIESFAFSQGKLKEVYIPSSVEYIGELAFIDMDRPNEFYTYFYCDFESQPETWHKYWMYGCQNVNIVWKD